ncbi:MAG: DUF512 domain-containing protein [Eggerthellaceae bacterium]|nr:DUF512 domain-containing protein [Eggerthellaceae bacterium]
MVRRLRDRRRDSRRLDSRRPDQSCHRVAEAAVSQYPPKDFERDLACRALIASVEPASPADDAGFSPGCFITAVDGQPLRDAIDWRWLSSEDVIRVSYIDLDGDKGEVELWREPGEDWGFEFEGLVFDEVKQCRNACTFCFMRQLPPGMRPSLSLRDDDFRLSFLVGTFITCTNLTPEDEARIIEQRISPLRVSLQASNPQVRRRLIGKHAQHGIDALERLLAVGIEFHAQIVLVPGENDGDALAETLSWAYERPGILGIGIVPLGYTRFQTMFDHSFNDKDAARGLLDIVEPFQKRAMKERGTPWVFAADEFYRNAYPDDLLDHLPPTEFYGDFAMFEDGIGIVRSTVDDWNRAEGEGAVAACANALRQAHAVARMVVGCAQREFLEPLIAHSGIADIFQPLYVPNAFFGGNVDVTGLLVADDIVNAIVEEGHLPRSLFLIPCVVFNDDGLTLDGMTLEEMGKAAGQNLHMVSCTPAEYFNEIIALIA